MLHPDVQSATPEDLPTALQILFQHLPPEQRVTAAAQAEAVLQRGEVDRHGLLVARRQGELVGAMLTVAAPGGMGLVWPPQVRAAAPEPIEDALVRTALARLRGQGVKFAQAMLLAEERDLGLPLLRHGFAHVTTLWCLRRVLDSAAGALARGGALTFHSYSADTHAELKATLLQTYEGTLDCPELDGVRDGEEVLAGHKAQGQFDPALWWVARWGDRPVGVLLVNPMPEWQSWEIVYMGIIPEARGRGFGRQLLAQAGRLAQAAGVPQLTLTVDGRNHAARRLYEQFGFEPWDQREVYLIVLTRS
jgi:ribosomal protein S18 acetylase RimI-like enzyme